MIAVKDKQIRILDTQEMLQKAMDYCEVWFTGYDSPKGTITVDRCALEDAIEDSGGVENLAMALGMELNSTHEGTKTVN